MTKEIESEPRAYFDDPRLHMSTPGRLIVRVTSWIAQVLLIAAAVSFLLAVEVVWLRAPGILLTLFLLDRALHYSFPDRLVREAPKEGSVNAARYVSPAGFTAIERAFDRSAIVGEPFLLELARQLLSSGIVREALRRLDILEDEFRAKVDGFIAEAHAANQAVGTPDERRVDADAVVTAAFGIAEANQEPAVGPAELFGALATLPDEHLRRLFHMFSIGAGDVEHALIMSLSRRRNSTSIHRRAAVTAKGPRRLRHRIMNRAWTSRPTPVLDQVSTDFTDLARQGYLGFLVGHEHTYGTLIDTLARPVNPNAILVGDPGVGKEAVVGHLAHALVHDEVPEALFDKRLVAVELGGLVAGTDEGALQKKLKTIIEEITVAGNIILYIPEIHNLVRTSGSAYLSAADALLPIIADNAFPIIGTSYPREFTQFIEPRSDFLATFETVRMNELSAADAEKLLAYEAALIERQFRRLVVSFGAVRTAVRVAKKYLHTKPLPGSAVELLKEAASVAGRAGARTIGPEEIIAVAEKKVNVPIHGTDTVEAKALLNLEGEIHKELIGQEAAVKAVADALREYRSGLSRPGGPIASFLFVGPTGVGKTQLAKIVARHQFGSEEAMVRFDMSEYQDKTSIYRLIGSPDGSIQGALTEAVMHQPYSLVLFDEFEKAHLDLLNLFLQVLDDGRLTDGLGRTVDFTNTIIIATSNAKSDLMNDALAKGEQIADIAEYVRQRLVDVFKPELLNRFSKIIVFRNLAFDEVEQIARIQLHAFAETVREQSIELDFDPATVTAVAKLGYDPAFGARPLRRVIEERLRAPLAEAMLAGTVKRGGRARVVLDHNKAIAFISVGDDKAK